MTSSECRQMYIDMCDERVRNATKEACVARDLHDHQLVEFWLQLIMYWSVERCRAVTEDI